MVRVEHEKEDFAKLTRITSDDGGLRAWVYEYTSEPIREETKSEIVVMNKFYEVRVFENGVISIRDHDGEATLVVNKEMGVFHKKYEDKEPMPAYIKAPKGFQRLRV